MVTIYYKNNQLDKYRTCKSILRYYFWCYINHKPIQKVSIPVDNLEPF